MNVKSDNTQTGLDRFNALLTWWGVPSGINFGTIEGPTKHSQLLASDLCQAFNEASSCQIKPLFATNERLACSLQDILRSRQPHELTAAQSNLVTGLLESIAAQTKTWADLTQKVHGCCATMVRETAEEAAKQVGSAAPAAPARSEAERPAGKETGKRATQG